MASITSQLIVELLDRVSGPARSVANSLRGMNRRIKEASSGSISVGDRIAAAQTRTNRALERSRVALIDAVAGYYLLKKAIGAPLGSAMKMETTLSGIASKAGLSADEIGRLRNVLREASRATNQYAADLGSGVDYLVGMGMSGADASAVIKTIGMTSTAAGANVREMSGVAYTAMSNLKIPADQLQLALDAAALAGKRGGFEFRDMAAFLPALGAAYGAQGQSGVRAMADLSAALQVTRADTGDASAAATNLGNVIQKTFAPATVSKFKKEGVDLFAEMEAASKRGITPLEAIADITNRTLGGDLSKLGNLFEDTQAQAGVRSLIRRMEEYRKIREEAMSAGGTNQADFDRMMGTTAEKVKSAQIAFENFKESLGTSLIPVLQKIGEYLIPMVDALARFTENNPTLVAAIATTAAAFVALRVALAGLSFLGLTGKSGALAVLSGALRLLGSSVAGLGMGALLGIGAGIAAIGMAAGSWAYINWDELSSGWKAFTDNLTMSQGDQATWKTVANDLRSLSGMDFGAMLKLPEGTGASWGAWLGQIASSELSAFTRDFARFTQDLRWYQSVAGSIFSGAIFRNFAMEAGMRFAEIKYKLMTSLEGVGQFIGQKTNEWVAWFSGLPGRVAASIGSLYDVGVQFMQSFFDGLKSIANSIVKYTSGIGSRIRSSLSFSGVDGVSGDPMGAAPVDDHRAKGGPISRGSTYLVGERGPELITAGRSGYVNRAGSQGGGSIAVSPVFNMTFNGKTDADDVVQQIRRVMRDEVRETFRGVFADTGMRFA